MWCCRRFGHPLRIFALLSALAVIDFKAGSNSASGADKHWALFGHMIAELGDNPLREFIHLRFGSCGYATQSDSEGAVREFQIALSIDPNDPEVHKDPVA